MESPTTITVGTAAAAGAADGPARSTATATVVSTAASAADALRRTPDTTCRHDTALTTPHRCVPPEPGGVRPHARRSRSGMSMHSG
jgi:hypothetical protein